MLKPCSYTTLWKAGEQYFHAKNWFLLSGLAYLKVRGLKSFPVSHFVFTHPSSLFVVFVVIGDIRILTVGLARASNHKT